VPDPDTLVRWGRKALVTPPRRTAAIGWRKASGAIAGTAARRRDRRMATYDLGADPTGSLARFLGLPPAGALDERREEITALADLYLEHRFDLLGSGWVQVRHGMACAGIDGIVHPTPDAVAGPVDPVRLLGMLNEANRSEAGRIRSLIGRDYQPIDWQLDFKSGFRWPEQTWHRDVRYGHVRGADVKVPWELGRSQHLPQLALAAALAKHAGAEGRAARLAHEFRDQVLDFVAACPPRYGVQWVTTMDVAIRAANWLVAWDLFAAADATFDDAFVEVFRRSILEHGRHIATNLEWAADLRGNHYLADVVGLLFVAAYLPQSPRTDAWLLFAVREVIAETRLQFHEDGGNFEGSTCYHRLSAEMATYALALILALSPSRVASLSNPDAAVLRHGSGFPGAPLAAVPLHENEEGRLSPVPPGVLDRLACARALTAALTKPGGRVPQLGDNDSGRFLRLAPAVDEQDTEVARRRYANLADIPSSLLPPVHWREDHLDHRHLADAFDGLLGGGSGPAPATPGIDAHVVGSLARPPGRSGARASGAASAVRIGTTDDLAAFRARLGRLPEEQRATICIPVPGGGLLDDLGLLAFPEFGAFLFRSGRLFLVVRCGRRGQAGVAGHDHNDQLSLELNVDGEDWIRDPGSYVYTPLPERRNAYRSVRAHFAPQLDGAEPASLEVGLFTLGPGNDARCVYWGEQGFAGLNRYGDGRVALCQVEVADGEIRVHHGAEGARLCRPERADDWRSYVSSIQYSPGYGIVER
jgi:hypothetical protein